MILDYVDGMIRCAKTHYHVGTIINSSGTGKTRLAKEVISKRRGIYLGLNNGHNGVRLLSHIAEYEQMMQTVENAPVNSREKLVAKLIYSFAFAAGSKDADELYNLQFGEGASLHTSVYQKWKQIQGGGGTPSKIISLLGGSGPTDGKESVVKFVDDVSNEFDIDSMSPLVIVIDEAAVLSSQCTGDDRRSTLQVLRRICTRFPNCFLLLLSTGFHTRTLNSSTACCNLPSRSTDPDLERLTNKLLCMPPFFRTTHLAHFAEPFHPFSFGRPLWASKFRNTTVTTEFLRKLVAEAASMLKGKSHKDEQLALFGVRYSLAAFGSVADNLVQNNLAIIRNVIMDDTGADTYFIATAQFAHEPVLAEVACIKMSSLTSQLVSESISPEVPRSSRGLCLVLNEVEKSLRFTSSIGGIDVGECGELMSAVVLTGVLDDLKAKELHLKGYNGDDLSFTKLEISAGDFFAKFADMIPEILDCLDKYSVNFTHFQRRQSTNQLTQQDLHMLYIRSCALFCRKNFEGTDIVFPVKLNGSGPAKYVLGAIQVKCYSSMIGPCAATSIVNKIDVKKIVQDWKSDSNGGIDVIRVLISVGRGGARERSWQTQPKTGTRAAGTAGVSSIDFSVDLRRSIPIDFCEDSWKIIQRLLDLSEPSDATAVDYITIPDAGSPFQLDQTTSRTVTLDDMVISTTRAIRGGYPDQLRDRIESAKGRDQEVLRTPKR
jgi:hypothetical protein